MLIAGYAQEVSSRYKDRRNRTHVDHSLTCCSEENSKFVHTGLLTFGSQGLDYTNTIHAFIHTFIENKTELSLLKIDEHRWKDGISVTSSWRVN